MGEELKRLEKKKVEKVGELRRLNEMLEGEKKELRRNRQIKV